MHFPEFAPALTALEGSDAFPGVTEAVLEPVAPRVVAQHAGIDAPDDTPWFMGAREIGRVAHQAGVVRLAFHPDGSKLASAAAERIVRISDTSTGLPIAELTHGWFTFVRAVAFSATGLLATGSDDHEVRLWDLGPGDAGKLPHKNVNAVTFSPDGSLLATAGMDKTARIWDVAAGVEIASLQHDASVHAVSFSPTGDRLATGANKMARVWQVRSGIEIAKAGWEAVMDWACNVVAFSPDGKRVASGGQNSTVRVWDAGTGVIELELTHPGLMAYVMSLAFSGDGRYLVTGGDKNDARIWDTRTGEQLALLQHRGPVNAVAFSRDGRHVATGSGDKTACVWEAPSGRQLAQISHNGAVRAVAFSPTGALLATGSDDKSVRLVTFRT